MKIGIMGAMLEEVTGIIDGVEGRVATSIGGRDYWEGHWHGHDVVVVFSRMGKVASAATAAILLTRFEVDHVLFIGVAGAVDPELDLGDVIVAGQLVQHDMDASAIPPFQRFEIPLLGQVRFAADEAAAAIAVTAAQSFVAGEFDSVVPEAVRLSFAMNRPKVRHGLIASGDRFVTDGADLRVALPDLLCVEMEGAAVAQVCFELGAPLTVIRIVSDRADHDAPVDFPRFTAEVASVMTKGIAGHFLADLVRHRLPSAA